MNQDLHYKNQEQFIGLLDASHLLILLILRILLSCLCYLNSSLNSVDESDRITG